MYEINLSYVWTQIESTYMKSNMLNTLNVFFSNESKFIPSKSLKIAGSLD